jgi:hypothetical protein
VMSREALRRSQYTRTLLCHKKADPFDIAKGSAFL